MHATHWFHLWSKGSHRSRLLEAKLTASEYSANMSIKMLPFEIYSVAKANVYRQFKDERCFIWMVDNVDVLLIQ